METYAFIGPSGTGKSHNAQRVALEYNINYIIDDALLISKTKVLAGKSAKTEATKIASVKAAIFNDESRCSIMKQAIKSANIDKLLILGTSDEMVDKIAERLRLPYFTKKVYIEDVTSKEDMDIAKKTRLEQGKHVVPVPTLEIKEQFSGYLLDPLKILGKKDKSYQEKSVIRPTFSYLGNFYISDKVIKDIVEYSGRDTEGISKINRIIIDKYVDGIKITIDVNVIYGTNIKESTRQLHSVVAKDVNHITGINIFSIDIFVKGIDFSKKK